MVRTVVSGLILMILADGMQAYRLTHCALIPPHLVMHGPCLWSHRLHQTEIEKTQLTHNIVHVVSSQSIECNHHHYLHALFVLKMKGEFLATVLFVNKIKATLVPSSCS